MMKTFLLLAVCLVSLPCHARDFTFTVMVEAGKSDCFYDYIHKGAFLEVEYQVCLSGPGETIKIYCCETSMRSTGIHGPLNFDVNMIEFRPNRFQ